MEGVRNFENKRRVGVIVQSTRRVSSDMHVYHESASRRVFWSFLVDDVDFVVAETPCIAIFVFDQSEANHFRDHGTPNGPIEESLATNVNLDE